MARVNIAEHGCFVSETIKVDLYCHSFAAALDLAFFGAVWWSCLLPVYPARCLLGPSLQEVRENRDRDIACRSHADLGSYLAVVDPR